MKKIYLLLMMLALMFTTQSAFAIDTDWMTPANNSLFAEYIKNIFGIDLKDAFGSAKSMQETTFSWSLKMFSSAVVSLAGLAFLYVTVVGTVQTANDGEALGKKWNTIWVPIKLVLGIALILPLPNYSICQILLFKFYGMGLGIAEYQVKEGVDKYQLSAIYGNDQSDRESIQPILDALLKANMCNLQATNQWNKTQTQGAESLKAKQYTYSSSGKTPNYSFAYNAESSYFSNKMTYTWSFGDQNSSNRKDSCGIVTFEGIDSADSDINSNDFVLTDKLKPDLDMINQSFIQTHVQSINQMNQDALIMASKLISGQYNNYDEFSKDYVNSISKTDKALTEQGKNLFNRYVNKDNLGAITDYGIVSLAVMPLTIKTVQSSIQQYRDKKTIVNTDFEDLDENKTNEAILKMNQYIASAKSKINPSISPRSSESSQESDGLMDKIIAIAVNKLPNVAPYMSTQKLNVDPLSNAINLGLTLQHSAENAMIAMAATIAGEKVVSKIPGAGKVLSIALKGVSGLVEAVAKALIFTIMIPAVLLANVLPWIPSIVFFFSLVSSILYLVKGLPGVQLWAMTFILPDGDDFVGRQGQGYMNYVIAFFQLPLTYLGYQAGMACLNESSKMLNWIFGIMSLTQTSGLTGFISYIVGMIVYATLLTIVVKMCFSLCYLVPDALFAWLGNTTNHLGRHEGSEQGVLGAAASVGGIASKAGSIATSAIKGTAISGNEKDRMEKMASRKSFSKNSSFEPDKFRIDKE
ncbi:TPA: DotA/TraY family protein [Klebsiella aerogenes]